jgi:5-methylcytosine-specific restriction endonuclease McrA
VWQVLVLSDAGQRSDEAVSADVGANSEDQGGDQAKDSKRRFDKGQRERAVDNARDESGEPRCTYCGQKLNDQSGQGNSTEIDHVKAHSRGGKTTDDNAAASCRSCNRSKGAKELGTEWVPPTGR